VKDAGFAGISSPTFSSCVASAHAFYVAVSVGGDGAYWDAQDEACVCECNYGPWIRVTLPLYNGGAWLDVLWGDDLVVPQIDELPEQPVRP